MGQIYRLTEDQDDLLSEAEKAFDLSARRQSIGWSEEPKQDEHVGSRFGFMSAWLRRTDGENRVG